MPSLRVTLWYFQFSELQPRNTVRGATTQCAFAQDYPKFPQLSVTITRNGSSISQMFLLAVYANFGVLSLAQTIFLQYS